MSGGKAYRHGYYATLPNARPQPASGGVDFDGIFIVIIASMLIVFVTALATDPSLLGSAEQWLRTVLSDLLRRYLAPLASRASPLRRGQTGVSRRRSRHAPAR